MVMKKKCKKIGIWTIQSPNYGNRLQNYAMQETLKSLGYKPETILRSKQSTTKRFLQQRVRPIIKKDRYSCFHSFDSKINWSKCVVSRSYISHSKMDRFSYFIIGSDQIWNPYIPYISELDYLPMAPSEKKVAYAASFGVSDIPDEMQTLTAELLNTIPYITVREEAGAAIVQRLTGRTVPVVLDPTLLLSVDDWIKVSKKPYGFDKTPYAIKYFLGEYSDAEDRFGQICETYHLRSVDILDENFAVGPSEFLYLIQNASLVCTDSFHASLFAFLFRRPLIIFERSSNIKDMSSRIDTLCDMFLLNTHRLTNSNFSMEIVWKDDYKTGHNNLTKEKQKSVQLLKNALI